MAEEAGGMKSTYTPPKAASWTFVIYSVTGEDAHLIEDAPYDEDTRTMYQLRKPIRKWLAANDHQMIIDRGDFGDGAEHFHITFDTKVLADAFAALCV